MVEDIWDLVEYVKETPLDFDYTRVSFPQQGAFIEDPNRLKALFCTRRAAKSYTAGIYLIKTALEHPNSNCLFIGLTRLSAHGIIWKDILKELDLKYALGMKFNETLLTATFPNGSIIYVAGADDNESEMNKLLGKKYRLVTIDEASMFSINMEQLVYGVLKPATADLSGTICLIGTASNTTRGLFYKITTGQEDGWSLHQWTAYDNPHIAKKWAVEIQDIETNRPLFKETSLFKQWYLNEWVVDENARVYRYNALANWADNLPYTSSERHYILGIDLGHSPDPSAFTVGYWTKDEPILYFIHAEKHLEMDITAVADKVSELDRKYKFLVKVCDGANKQAVAELNNRHKLNIIPADKTGKSDFINLMNDEYVQKKIMLTGSTKDLADELETCTWLTDNGKVKIPRKEDPNCANHLLDSHLYAWRHCYQYLFAPPRNIPHRDSLESWEPRHIEKLSEEIKQAQSPDPLRIEFDESLWEDLDQPI